jgi:hypothetical protein
VTKSFQAAPSANSIRLDGKQGLPSSIPKNGKSQNDDFSFSVFLPSVEDKSANILSARHFRMNVVVLALRSVSG